jgi:hypothetical protein
MGHVNCVEYLNKYEGYFGPIGGQRYDYYFNNQHFSLDPDFNAPCYTNADLLFLQGRSMGYDF